MSKKVTIVIPIYQNRLTKDDLISFEQCYKIHHNYPIVIVKPEGLDLSWLHNKYPNVGEETFDANYFKSIEGYNSLMLSYKFYERFLESEYVLIYQLDAFVFDDQLTEWCDKGYDYIGAPWILKPKYEQFPHSILFFLKGMYAKLLSKPNRQKLYFQVGNGGLSLRKTSSFYAISKEDKKIIAHYLHMKKKVHWFNEDVYWAIEAKIHDLSFRIPDYKEALKFSFDLSPQECYRMNDHKLPYGCHAWTKFPMNVFWKPFIDSAINNRNKI